LTNAQPPYVKFLPAGKPEQVDLSVGRFSESRRLGYAEQAKCVDRSYPFFASQKSVKAGFGANMQANNTHYRSFVILRLPSPSMRLNLNAGFNGFPSLE